MKNTAIPTYSRLVASLLFNSLRFRYHRLMSSPLKPAVLSLAVTNRCNSRCIMCNIWKSARDDPSIKSLELPGRQILETLSSPLFSDLVELDLTGGEPHLREDLVDIVLGIAHLKERTLPRLRSIIITSNGFLSKRITKDYREILLALKDTNIDLVGVLSLDGLGETHDMIRGTTGAFRLVSETLENLAGLKQEFANLVIGVKTTVLPQNADFLKDILDFASSRKLFHIISPVLFTAARFKNLDRRDELDPGPSLYGKLLDFYSRQDLRANYFYSVMRDRLATHRKKWRCAALYNYIFIDFDGNVYPCEIMDEPIGNIKEQPIQDIWNGKLARIRRRQSGRWDRCRTCHEPGAIRYSAVTEGLSYLRFLTKLGKRAYTASYYGEGYSKYIV